MKNNITDLQFTIITSITVSDDREEIEFTTCDGKSYKMYHNQDCCEHVYVEDIVGDLDDLIDTPIIAAREDTNSNNPLPDSDASHTWTFYTITTLKGTVTIRWYGTSNGYYSEAVNFIETTTKEYT
jgi:hypothetical protein